MLNVGKLGFAAGSPPAIELLWHGSPVLLESALDPPSPLGYDGATDFAPIKEPFGVVGD